MWQKDTCDKVQEINNELFLTPNRLLIFLCTEHCLDSYVICQLQAPKISITCLKSRIPLWNGQSSLSLHSGFLSAGTEAGSLCQFCTLFFAQVRRRYSSQDSPTSEDQLLLKINSWSDDPLVRWCCDLQNGGTLLCGVHDKPSASIYRETNMCHCSIKSLWPMWLGWLMVQIHHPVILELDKTQS
jgi:hypothetical protein